MIGICFSKFATSRRADNDKGRGINRMRLGGGLRQSWFPFTTTFDTSVVDDHPCVRLDYDSEENPRLIRKIRDELRQVGPTLYLGPVFFNTPAKPQLMAYFAVQP